MVAGEIASAVGVSPCNRSLHLKALTRAVHESTDGCLLDQRHASAAFPSAMKPCGEIAHDKHSNL